MGLGMMSGSSTVFYMALFWGLIGMSYFVYGKKQGNFIALMAGMGLMIFPYFVSKTWVSAAVGIVLVILPFIL